MSGPRRPPAIWCVGRNYADHAKEMGGDAPEHPMFFMKNPAAVIGDGDPIVIPSVCREPHDQVDWEAELAVVLGRDAFDLSEADAIDAVDGYAVANDVTARWWQKHGSGGQFCRGKSFDGFCPLGDIVPASTVGPVDDLQIETRLNGDVVQSSRTSNMIFSIPRLLADLTRGTTLVAGTVLLTGTPSGVGAARTPPRFLQDGDEVEIRIEGIGRLRNPVRTA